MSDPGVYAPFSIAEYRLMPLPSSVLDTCLTWHVPSPAHPPGQPVPPGYGMQAAAALTAGDAMARWWVNYSGTGVGLRGGSFQYVDTGNYANFTLDSACGWKIWRLAGRYRGRW